MPPLPPAPWPLSIPAMRAGAASMPALPLAGIAGLSIADAPPLLFVRAAAAPASLQGLPAQLAAAAAAASAGAPALGGISVPGSSAAAGAAARPPTASRLVQPGAVSPAPGTYGPAPSSSNMPDLSAAAAAGAGLQYAPSPALVPPFGSLHGLSSAVAAVPGSPAAFPPPSFLQQPAGLAAAPGDAASPSADLSSRTVAGGPGDASPATSGGSGLSSPNKRKRGAEQVRATGWGQGKEVKGRHGVCIAACIQLFYSTHAAAVTPRSLLQLPVSLSLCSPPFQRSVLLPPGTVLRFSASRDGSLVGLRAFRLPGHTRFSNWFALMTVRTGWQGCSPSRCQRLAYACSAGLLAGTCAQRTLSPCVTPFSSAGAAVAALPGRHARAVGAEAGALCGSAAGLWPDARPAGQPGGRRPCRLRLHRGLGCQLPAAQ